MTAASRSSRGRIANKTGTGDYGTADDIAVVWPPHRQPILVAIMSSKSAANAKYDEATAYVVRTLIRPLI